MTALKATSVLLVGVTRIEGDFEKDDIVKIMNEEGKKTGVGCTAYDSEEARKQIATGFKTAYTLVIIYIWIKSMNVKDMLRQASMRLNN